MQGGVKNYLGNQKMVNAPLHWRSGPQHPSTELAYITQAEKDLLVNKDLHASLKGGVNRGPSGIMSLNGWGDTGEGFADKSFAGNERRGRDVQVTTRNIHDVPQTVTRKTKTVSPKDHFEQSWSGPKSWWGGGGYRDLKTPSVTGGDRPYKSRLGGIGRGLLSLFGGVPGKVVSALSNFKGNENLAEWWRNRNTPVEEESEEITSDYRINPVTKEYEYVGGSMDDTMQEFRQKYPLELRNTNVGVDYPNYLTSNLGGNYQFNAPRYIQPVDNNDIFTDSGVPSWGQGAKDGGRIGYAFAGPVGVEQRTDFIEGPQGANEFQETVVEGQRQPSREQLEALAMEIFQLPLEELDDQQLVVVYQEAMQGQPMEEAVQEEDVQFAANGGRAGYLLGGDIEQQTDFLEGPQENLMASEPHGMSDAFDMYNDAIQNGTFEGTFDEFLEELERMTNKFRGAEGGLASIL